MLVLLALAAIRRLLGGPYWDFDKTVLEYSQVTWDEVWQRPQQYAWIASEARPVVYCCPVQIHNLLFLKTKWRPVRRFMDGNRQLLVLSPLIFSGHFKTRWIHEINCLMVSWYLRMAITDRARVHALVNTPFSLRVLENCYYEGDARDPKLARLVFDVIDDFTIFDWSPAFGLSFDKKLMAMSDKVIAGTHELADARDNAEFIACGVDFELFATERPQPSALRSLPRPILGYFGTISERIDLQIIADLADNFPESSVVMVGPVHLPEQSLPQRSNIHYLGLQRHADLPAFAQSFDVALIPFSITPATVKLNPVKTLEYLAAGLPVVATRLPDLERFYSDVVYIAASREAYMDEVRKVLAARDEDRIQSGVKIARTASWNGMVDKMNDALFPCSEADEIITMETASR